jgi:PIN domain nuclease of toxin-antitoxin system
LILLDTHVLLWIVGRPARLSKRAGDAIRRAAAGPGLAIASVTLFEMADLAARGRVRIKATPEAWLRAVVQSSQVVVHELTVEVAVVAAHLPPDFPPDPFDRLIAATALVGGMSLVTADQRVQDSGVVRTIW